MQVQSLLRAPQAYSQSNSKSALNRVGPTSCILILPRSAAMLNLIRTCHHTPLWMQVCTAPHQQYMPTLRQTRASMVTLEELVQARLLLTSEKKTTFKDRASKATCYIFITIITIILITRTALTTTSLLTQPWETFTLKHPQHLLLHISCITMALIPCKLYLHFQLNRMFLRDQVQSVQTGLGIRRMRWIMAHH